VNEFLQTPLGVHLLFIILALPPLVMIYRRAGLKLWGAFLVILPVLGFVLSLAALVGQRWPSAQSRRDVEQGPR